MAKVRFNFLIEKEELRKLKIVAVNKETTVTNIILKLLDDYMREEEQNIEA